MSEEKVKDLSFKFQEMYDFLEECGNQWSLQIAEIPIQNERFQWLIKMSTIATLLKVKLQIFEQHALNEGWQKK